MWMINKPPALKVINPFNCHNMKKFRKTFFCMAIFATFDPSAPIGDNCFLDSPPECVGTVESGLHKPAAEVYAAPLSLFCLNRIFKITHSF